METKQIRQILMNELGLTRASIREMVEDIVATTMHIHLQKMISEPYFEKLVHKEINRLVADNKWDKESIRSIIAKAAGEEIKNRVFNFLATNN